MAISNLQEKLLFYTQQKSRISSKLSDIQMQQLSASRQVAEKQLEYNSQLSDIFYEYGETDLYGELLLELQSDHEFELSKINTWESELEVQKEGLETQLNEISSYEQAWQKLLTNNIKVEFTYGGSSGGK